MLRNDKNKEVNKKILSVREGLVGSRIDELRLLSRLYVCYKRIVRKNKEREPKDWYEIDEVNLVGVTTWSRVNG